MCQVFYWVELAGSWPLSDSKMKQGRKHSINLEGDTQEKVLCKLNAGSKDAGETTQG